MSWQVNVPPVKVSLTRRPANVPQAKVPTSKYHLTGDWIGRATTKGLGIFTVCTSILLAYVCIAVPCKFLKICHHATILSSRLLYLLLCVPLSHCLQVWENLPPCHLTMYYIVLCVAVCAIVLLSFACIAIPCKFWKTCHHATYLSIR